MSIAPWLFQSTILFGTGKLYFCSAQILPKPFFLLLGALCKTALPISSRQHVLIAGAARGALILPLR